MKEIAIVLLSIFIVIEEYEMWKELTFDYCTVHSYGLRPAVTTGPIIVKKFTGAHVAGIYF